MDAELFLDPSCMWCWTTSQWLADVSAKRDVTIRPRPFSLFLPNGTTGLPPRYASARIGSHRALRVLTAIDEPTAAWSFYRALMRSGRAAFARGEQPFADLPNVLAELRLDPALAAEADNPNRDLDTKQSMAAAAAVLRAGQDELRIPILTIADGARRTVFHGPLISAPIPDTHAAEIWDAFVALAQVSEVCELSRPRPVHPKTTAA